jgi:hypothetical protein
MGVMTTPRSTFISNFMSDYIRMGKPLPGSTQKEAAANKAAWEGVRRGMRFALEYQGNEMRRQKARELNLPAESPRGWIPALSERDFMMWLRSVQERWDREEWKDTSDADFYALMQEEFESIVFNDSWDEYYFATRKEAVMEGRIPPTADDKEWIVEELDAFKDVVTPYERLLATLADTSGSVDAEVE